MARIRSIKPEFFRHRRLYLLEREAGLPVRVAFAGLWTVADREGRFRWEPDELKLDCLPYDDVDFSRVLDALATRGFVVRYASHGREYGVIPGFVRHQIINNRETASTLPPPPEDIENAEELTRASRVIDACPTPLVQGQGEGSGKGGEGRGRERESPLTGGANAGGPGTESPSLIPDAPAMPKPMRGAEVKLLEDARVIWNDVCAPAGLAAVQKLSDTRKSRLKSRLKEMGNSLDSWRAYCERITRSSNLRGEKSRNGWKADFDYCIREDIAIRIIEGQFDDKSPAAAKPARAFT